MLRTADPVCGFLNFDVAGTLQRGWYNEIDQFASEDLNIAFVYDQVIPDQPIISVGFVPGISSEAYQFDPRDDGRVNRHFRDINSGAGVYCYQDLRDRFDRSHPETHLLVEIPETGRLLVRAEDGFECGADPWEIGAGATEFVR